MPEGRGCWFRSWDRTPGQLRTKSVRAATVRAPPSMATFTPRPCRVAKIQRKTPL